jgi:hypothetical protein
VLINSKFSLPTHGKDEGRGWQCAQYAATSPFMTDRWCLFVACILKIETGQKGLYEAFSACN